MHHWGPYTPAPGHANDLTGRPASSTRPIRFTLDPLVHRIERAIAVENKWRAQRYGTDCIFASKDGPITISELLSRVIAETADDADALRCSAEVEHCRTILLRGSSAEFQLRAYDDSKGDIAAVSQWIAATTVAETKAPFRSAGAQVSS